LRVWRFPFDRFPSGLPGDVSLQACKKVKGLRMKSLRAHAAPIVVARIECSEKKTDRRNVNALPPRFAPPYPGYNLCRPGPGAPHAPLIEPLPTCVKIVSHTMTCQ
jgi:hypothetical protein